MADFIIKNKINDPLQLQNFNSDGYIYSPTDSNKKTWVFCRPQP